MGGGCWRYRRPIVMDDTREGLVWAWYREWIDRRQIGPRKWVKNRVKSWILLVWDAQQTVLAENLIRLQEIIYSFRIKAQKYRFM